jgi:hypothetical protein
MGIRSIDFTATARRLGMSSAVGVVLLSVAYTVTLAAGLLSLQSPDQPVGDPFFPVLEILIILLAPLMVAVMVSVHAWTPPEAKSSLGRPLYSTRYRDSIAACAIFAILAAPHSGCTGDLQAARRRGSDGIPSVLTQDSNALRTIRIGVRPYASRRTL